MTMTMNFRINAIATLLILFTLCSTNVTNVANATNLTVCASGCDYTVLETALSAASSGDTVSVKDVGPYTLSDYSYPNGVALIDSSGSTCIINAGANNRHLSMTNCTNSNTIINGFKIQGGNRTGNGGSINITTSFAGEFNGCYFYDNDCTGHGGVISYVAGLGNWTGTIIDCTFENNTCGINTVQKNGGAIYMDFASTDDEFILTSCTFDGNEASTALAPSGQGGAIYSDICSGAITSCVFQNNEANGNNGQQGHGGAVKISGKNLTIDKCRFLNNKITSGHASSVCYGAGLYVTGANAGSPIVSNCMFQGNEITPINNPDAQDGGGLYLYNFNGVVSGDSLYHNKAGRGAGCYHLTQVAGMMPTLFDNCRFIGNRATTTTGAGGRGGGLATDHTQFTVSNCYFEADTADANGGGLFCFDMATQTFDNCEFVNCIADSSGGAIAVNDVGSHGTIQNSTITTCKSNTHGGGIALIDSQRETGGTVLSGGLILDNVTITGCVADLNNNNSGNGGGIYFFWGSELDSLKNVTITDCTAYEGAGIYWLDDHGYLINSKISSNTAKNHGGGLFFADAWSSSTLSDTGAVQGCIISKNIATGNMGGGIYIARGAVDFFDVLIFDNSSTIDGTGGGLQIAFTETSLGPNVAVTRSTICDNIGGGIYLTNPGFNKTDFIMSRCIIDGNTQTGGFDNNAGAGNDVTFSCILSYGNTYTTTTNYTWDDGGVGYTIGANYHILIDGIASHTVAANGSGELVFTSITGLVEGTAVGSGIVETTYDTYSLTPYFSNRSTFFLKANSYALSNNYPSGVSCGDYIGYTQNISSVGGSTFESSIMNEIIR